MQELENLVLTNKGLQFVAEFEDTSQSGWFIGAGQAMMTRVSLFKETKGVVVEMVDHVFDLLFFNGMVHRSVVERTSSHKGADNGKNIVNVNGEGIA